MENGYYVGRKCPEGMIRSDKKMPKTFFHEIFSSSQWHMGNHMGGWKCPDEICAQRAYANFLIFG
jgi:hypothetical protein